MPRKKLGWPIAEEAKKLFDSLYNVQIITDSRKKEIIHRLLYLFKSVFYSNSNLKNRMSFIERLNDLFSSNSQKLEDELNKASSTKMKIWQIVTDSCGKIVNIVKKGENLIDDTKLQTNKPKRGRPRNISDKQKWNAKINDRYRINYKRIFFASFLEELEENNSWFRNLLDLERNEIIDNLSQLINADTKEAIINKQIVQILPLFWRKGLTLKKGLLTSEQVIFALDQTEKLFASNDLKKIKNITEEIKGYAEKNLLIEVLKEIENLIANQKLKIEEAITLSSFDGKLSKICDPNLNENCKQLFEKLEEIIPDLLVRTLFKDYLENEA